MAQNKSVSSTSPTQEMVSSKVDGVLMFNLILLGKMGTITYNNEKERRNKYLAIRDHIAINIDPLLIPKMSEKSWVKRYFDIRKKLFDERMIFENLDAYCEVLQEAMQMFSTVLYSKGYYQIEGINDDQYSRWIDMGD